jgi:Uma2 family endonuclease
MDSMALMRTTDDWTVDDLARLPDDGLRYELVDGVLLVSPAPRPRHQRAVLKLALLLRESCPDSLEVFIAPLDFQPTRRRSFQPDVLVVRVEDIGEENVQQPPVLAVEVLSPGTRARDQLLKRGVYAESGIPSYWLVDPDAPSLTVLWLGEDGGYDEVAMVHGDEAYDATRPFAVSVRPAALTRR